MYDVIVIGAGPSGCCAAKTLAQSGLSVLLLEKFGLPRYKSCSGQLIKKSIDLVQKYFGAEVPRSVMCTPTVNKGMVFTDDRGKEYRFEQAGLNVWRSSFDNFLAEHAAKSGAEVVDCSPVTDIKDCGGFVAVTAGGKRTEKAKYVIDCEGVVGAVKRGLLNTDCDFITTYQTFNEGSIDLDPGFFYAYLQPEFSEYDAWFNVKDGQLVLGVSVKDGGNVGEYYERFIAYMTEKHGLKISKQIKTDKWLMPRIRPDFHVDYGKGRVLFAGETAGFLNPMGEGISAGLESGYCAAVAVADNFGSPDKAVESYERLTRPLYAYMKRQWNLIADLTDTFKDMKN